VRQNVHPLLSWQPSHHRLRFGPADFDRVENLVREARRGGLRKQVPRSGDPPSGISAAEGESGRSDEAATIPSHCRVLPARPADAYGSRDVPTNDTLAPCARKGFVANNGHFS